MNKVWTHMILISCGILMISSPSEIINEMLSCSSRTVQLCISLFAIYAVWLGIIEILEKTGISEQIAKCLRPLIRKLFRINNPETEKIIAINISANLLGMGNASTPSGIKAMKLLDKNGATYGMIMLFVLNALTIQLIPSTIISIRASLGSANSSDIIFPTLLTSIISTTFGLFLVFIIDKLKRKRGKHL